MEAPCFAFVAMYGHRPWHIASVDISLFEGHRQLKRDLMQERRIPVDFQHLVAEGDGLLASAALIKATTTPQ